MQCSVFIAVSLDGFIARADGAIDWLSAVERPGEDYGYRRFHDAIDTILIGRNTYEVALGLTPWPYAGKRCRVLTHAPRSPEHNERFLSGTPAEVVQVLAGEGAQRVYVDGGAVIQQFLTAGLISDLTLSWIPVLLGEGIPLFGKTGRDIPLDLVASRPFASGLVQVEYRVKP